MNIQSGPMTGIESASCEIIDSSILSTQTVSDYTPVAIKSFQIIELDTNLFPLKIESRSNITLDETDSIVFSSVTAARENITAGGIQASVTAINAKDERIQLNWIVSYTNLCEILPFFQGNSLGWMEFVTDGRSLPRPETCHANFTYPTLSPIVSDTASGGDTSSPPSVSPTDGKVEASDDALSMNYYSMSYSYSFSYSNVPSYDYFSYSHSFSHDFSFSYDFSNDFPSDDYVPVLLNTRRRVRRTNINAFGRQVLRRKRRDVQ